MGIDKFRRSVAVPAGGLQIAGTAVTSTAAEINALAASAISYDDLVKVHAITASAVEVNYIDTSVVGTAVASKAAVLGANKNLDEFHTTALYLGTDAGTLMSATAAELNLLDMASGEKLRKAVTALVTAATPGPTLGTIPTGAILNGVELYVEIAFNAATVNQIALGGAAYNNILAVTAVSVIDTTTRLLPLNMTLATATAVSASYVQTGGAATTGVARVTLNYLV